MSNNIAQIWLDVYCPTKKIFMEWTINLHELPDYVKGYILNNWYKNKGQNGRFYYTKEYEP